MTKLIPQAAQETVSAIVNAWKVFVESNGDNDKDQDQTLLLRRKRKRNGNYSYEGMTLDVEMYMTQFLDAKDLAVLSLTNKKLNSLAGIICNERLKFVMGQHDLDSNGMVQAYRKNGLARLLDVLAHVREQTQRPSVGCGSKHTCVSMKITEKRSAVYSFGNGIQGQLGNGTRESSQVPIRVNVDQLMEKDETIDSVSCGDEHTILLTSSGRLISFGANLGGQLGDTTRDSRGQPKLVPNIVTRTRAGKQVMRFTQASAGRYFTAALSDQGSVAIFGEGLDVELLGQVILRRGDIPSNEKIVQIAAGDDHLLLLTDKNNLYACGNGYHGKLGLERTVDAFPRAGGPVAAADDDDENENIAAAPGANNNNNNNLVAAALAQTNATLPEKVALPADLGHIVQIAAGGNHSALVTGDGKLYTWGSCTNGELGIGKFARSVPEPTRVELSKDKPLFALSVSCGKSHTAVVTSDGNVFTFGSGSFSQDGKRSKFWATNKPQQTVAGELDHAKASLALVVCGHKHTTVLDSKASLFTFGEPEACGRTLRVAAAHPNFVPRKVNLTETTYLTRRLHSL